MLALRKLSLFAATVAAFALCPAVAHAHAFGQRYDLPLPLWLYIAGASAAVALSFVVAGLLARRAPGLDAYPRLNLLRWWWGRALSHRYVTRVLQAWSVAMFALLLACGFLGSQEPLANIVPTFVWIIWWIGLAYVCALVGDAWAVLNPWSVIASGLGAVRTRLFPGAQSAQPFIVPGWLGVWPAVILLLAFGWAELIWPARAIPANVAFAILIYSVVTWTGMLLFGRDEWLRRGEAFSVLFALLARFALTETRVRRADVCAACSSAPCRNRSAGDCVNCPECFRRARPADREWNLRPFGAGLIRADGVHVSELVFVFLVLSIVTFDGFVETATWQRLFDFSYYSKPSLLLSASAIGAIVPLSSVIFTLGFLLFPLGFFLIYVAVSKVMALIVGRSGAASGDGGRLSGLAIARIFVFSLVPIALAYHLAHYFSFLLTYGQLVIPLASDPFGFGWDIFRTRGYEVDIGVVGARFVWYTAVISIVVGHITAVWIAHVVTLNRFQDRAVAIRSQYPLVVLMIGYTAIGLWILAQPIVG